jgi:hypothetical protein
MPQIVIALNCKVTNLIQRCGGGCKVQSQTLSNHEHASKTIEVTHIRIDSIDDAVIHSTQLHQSDCPTFCDNKQLCVIHAKISFKSTHQLHLVSPE